jgi:hypothetical protein
MSRSRATNISVNIFDLSVDRAKSVISVVCMIKKMKRKV